MLLVVAKGGDQKHKDPIQSFSQLFSEHHQHIAYLNIFSPWEFQSKKGAETKFNSTPSTAPRRLGDAIRTCQEVGREDEVKQLTHLDSHNQIVPYRPASPIEFSKWFFEIEPRAVGDVFF